MKAKYIRVSTINQKIDRQLTCLENQKLYIDKVSGTTPFEKREQGFKLMNDILKGKINHVSVQSIDRLGRNITDIQNQLNWFVKNNTQVHIENIDILLLDSNKKINLISKIVIDILSSISNIELENIKERQANGIAIAKVKGVYTGRKKGATMSNSDYFKRHQDAVKLLNFGLSINKTSEITGKAYATIKKVKERLGEQTT